MRSLDTYRGARRAKWQALQRKAKVKIPWESFKVWKGALIHKGFKAKASKYKPHQGAREKTRRVQHATGNSEAATSTVS